MRPPRTCRPKVDLVPRPRFRCANVELVPLVRGRAGPEPAREPRVSGVCARGGADGGKVGALALALSERLLAIRPSCCRSGAPLLKRMSEQEKSSKHKRAPLFLRTYKDSYTHSLSTGTRTERIETHALHVELEDEGPHRRMPCRDCREPTSSYHSMDHLRASRGPRAAWSRAATW